MAGTRTTAPTKLDNKENTPVNHTLTVDDLQKIAAFLNANKRSLQLSSNPDAKVDIIINPPNFTVIVTHLIPRSQDHFDISRENLLIIKNIVAQTTLERIAHKDNINKESLKSILVNLVHLTKSILQEDSEESKKLDRCLKRIKNDIEHITDKNQAILLQYSLEHLHNYISRTNKPNAPPDLRLFQQQPNSKNIAYFQYRLDQIHERIMQAHSKRKTTQIHMKKDHNATQVQLVKQLLDSIATPALSPIAPQLSKPLPIIFDVNHINMAIILVNYLANQTQKNCCLYYTDFTTYEITCVIIFPSSGHIECVAFNPHTLQDNNGKSIDDHLILQAQNDFLVYDLAFHQEMQNYVKNKLAVIVAKPDERTTVDPLIICDRNTANRVLATVDGNACLYRRSIKAHTIVCDIQSRSETFIRQETIVFEYDNKRHQYIYTAVGTNNVIELFEHITQQLLNKDIAVIDVNEFNRIKPLVVVNNLTQGVTRQVRAQR